MRKVYLILMIFGLLFVVPNALAAITNISSTETFSATQHANQQHILSMEINDNKFTHAIFRDALNNLVWIASNDTGANWGTNTYYNDSETTSISNCGLTNCLNSGSITSDSAGNLYVAITNDNYELYFIKGTYDSDTNAWTWSESTQLVPLNSNQMYYPTILRQSTTGYSVNEDFLHIIVMANISTTYSEPAIYTSIDNGTTWGSTYPTYNDALVEKIITVTPDMDQRFPAAAIKAAATQHKIFLAFDNGSKVDYIVGRYQDASGFTWGTNYLAPDDPTNYNDGLSLSAASNSEDSCTEPAIVLTNDIIHLIYLNSTDADVYYTKKTDELSPWADAVEISTDESLVWSRLSLSMGKSIENYLYIMWSEYDGITAGPAITSIKYSKSTDLGDNWSEEIFKTGLAVNNIYYPSIELSEGVAGKIWFIYNMLIEESVYVDFIATNCGCPDSGDWLVTANQTCKNNGCNLTGDLDVSGNILFELYNYTIRMNSSSHGGFVINVSTNASMYIKDYSNITAYDPNFHFNFLVQSDVISFYYYNSFLSECGYDSANEENTGLFINGNTARIRGSEFVSNYNGIVINDSTPNELTSSNLTNNLFYGMLLMGGSAGDGNQMFDNRIYNNAVGQLNNSQCNYFDMSENYWGSTNLTDIRANITEHDGTCDNTRYVDLCPITDSGLSTVACPGDACNVNSDCVSDHQICLPDYNNNKFCGCSEDINDLYRLNTLTQFNCSSNSCVHDYKTYDNGTTESKYVQLNVSWADSNHLNWSCNNGYWSEDPFYNMSLDIKPTFLESLTTADGFSEIIYILVPQLFLPNASVLVAQLNIMSISYGGGELSEAITIDVGNDDTPEYTAGSGLTQEDSPDTVTFTSWMNTYLPDCSCSNCTADDAGNCLIGINVTTASPTGKAVISNLQIGLCQMKGQDCTYSESSGEEGKCYDYGADADLDCMQSCTVLDDCPNAIDYECCSGSNVCAHDDFGCPSDCGTIGQDCCVGNACTSGVCRCVAEADAPQCVDSTTTRYEIFNISEINNTNFVYYTYENSTGDLNSCCLSPDNTTCRGWLNITAS
ncbi:hypothetical protein HN510_05405 [Candidatus Woesearchaeota archaeon]|nr:hypothetical protein [Candidatus Woesearchaeota archaeon]